jgi:integrase
MSVQRYETGSGQVRYRTRYYDDAGRERSKTFRTRKDAIDFDREVGRKKTLGQSVPVPSDKTTLSQWAQQWWPSQVRKLDRSTVLTHESQWASYIEEQLGFYPVRRLANNPHLIAEWRDELLEAGVGAPTVARTMAVLSSCFTSAVERGVVPMNPVRGLPRPSVHRTRAIRALPPEVIEAIRLELLLAEHSQRDPLAARRDATFWSVLAYAGPRPGEGLALLWADIREQTVVFDKTRQLDLGREDDDEEADTKTKRFRATDLLPVLARDLGEWRVACGMPPDSAPVFPGSSAEGFWTTDQYRYFRRKLWARAVSNVAAADAARAHVVKQTPYVGRHSFISLMLRCGGPGGTMMDPPTLARMTGHSVEVLQTTYAHEIAEYRHGKRTPANTLIERARRAAAKERKARMRHRPESGEARAA